MSGVWVDSAGSLLHSRALFMMTDLRPCDKAPSSPTARLSALLLDGAGGARALSRRLGRQAKQDLNLQEASSLPPLPTGLTSPQNTFLEQDEAAKSLAPGAGLAPPRSQSAAGSAPHLAFNYLSSSWLLMILGRERRAAWTSRLLPAYLLQS